MDCMRCSKLPAIFFKNPNVYVKLPTNHHFDLFEIAMENMNYSFERQNEGFYIRNVDFKAFVDYLDKEIFNSVEQKDVMILPLEKDESLTFSSLSNYRNLESWSNFYNGLDVVSIIEDLRIKTLFQPIVDANTLEIYGYEALSRGILEDGSIMNPGELFSKAKAMDLLFFLDRVCREASIRAASKQNIDKKVFINFIPTSIYEPSLCLRSTARVLDEESMDSKQVVFEVVETERVADFNHLNRILNYYKDKGYSTALDDIGSGFSNIDALMELRPDYMKIDMGVVRNIHMDEKKQKKLDEYVKYGRRIELKILAEGIETMDEFNYLKGKGVDLMQGYLFGKPQEVPLLSVSI